MHVHCAVLQQLHRFTSGVFFALPSPENWQISIASSFKSLTFVYSTEDVVYGDSGSIIIYML